MPGTTTVQLKSSIEYVLHKIRVWGRTKLPNFGKNEVNLFYCKFVVYAPGNLRLDVVHIPTPPLDMAFVQFQQLSAHSNQNVANARNATVL